MCYSSFVRLQKPRDLENLVKGSVKVIANVTIRWRAYDFLLMFYSNNGSISVVSEIFNVEKYRDLEIPVKSQSRSLKVVPFDSLAMVSY